jgi:hypothetical protein
MPKIRKLRMNIVSSEHGNGKAADARPSEGKLEVTELGSKNDL